MKELIYKWLYNFLSKRLSKLWNKMADLDIEHAKKVAEIIHKKYDVTVAVECHNYEGFEIWIYVEYPDKMYEYGEDRKACDEFSMKIYEDGRCLTEDRYNYITTIAEGHRDMYYKKPNINRHYDCNTVAYFESSYKRLTENRIWENRERIQLV